MDGNGLNEAQRRAAAHMDGPMLVLAGPGSGKTTVILHRIKHLTAQGVDPRGILVVTFAKAAADELRARYAAISGGVCGVLFGTLHSFFFRVLRAAGQYTADSVVDGAKRKAIVRTLMKARNVQAAYDEETVERVCNALSRLRGGAFVCDAQASISLPRGMRMDTLTALSEDYGKALRDGGLLDFDGMLTECLALFKEQPQVLESWRARFPYVMTDEFQDVSGLQYECLKLLAAPANNLFAVGDDDQSIYGFRGASPSYMLGFQEDFPQAQTVVLDANYRSSASVVALANALIEHNTARSPKRMQYMHSAGASPVAAYPQNPHNEAEWLAERVLSMKNECPFEEIAVIFRMHIQAQIVADALTRRRIPFTQRESAANLYTHWIAEDIAAYFRLAANRLDDDALARIINRPSRYITNNAVAAARTVGKASREGALASLRAGDLLNKRQHAAMDLLALGINAIARRGAYDAIRYLREGVGYDETIKEQAERRGTDALTLLDIADALQEAARVFPDTQAWLAHAEAARSARPCTPEASAGVTLTTMHGAKGLEFDAVFVIGAVDGLVPHRDGEEEEERRLLYVALTRARKWLYISAYKESGHREMAVSRFLRPFLKQQP